MLMHAHVFSFHALTNAAESLSAMVEQLHSTCRHNDPGSTQSTQDGLDYQLLHGAFGEDNVGTTLYI